LLASQLGTEIERHLEQVDALSSTPELYTLSPVELQAAWEGMDWRLFDSSVLLLDRSGTVVTTIPDRIPLFQKDWSEVAALAQLESAPFARAYGICTSAGKRLSTWSMGTAK
jgi:hypothetical protein